MSKRTYYLKYEYYINTLSGITKYIINKYELKIINSIDYSSPQGIIQYETPGGNGGATINTGRKTKRLDLSGVITSKILIERTIKYTDPNYPLNRNIEQNITLGGRINQDPYDLQKEIENIKDNGYLVSLIYKDNSISSKSLYSKWIIENFESTMNAGTNYLTFRLALKEYRQANIKTTKVNQVNTKAKLQFVSNLQSQYSVKQ